MVHFEKILLISHEMTYTGAPNSLLNIARSLREKGVGVEVCTLYDGAFSAEFEKYNFTVKTVSAGSYDFSVLPKKYDIVIANTVFCGEFALKAQRYVPTYLYIREGENLKDIIGNCGLKNEYVTDAKHLICVSEYARGYIENNFKVREICVLHNFLYEEKYSVPAPNIVHEGIVRFLIASTLEERKGIAVALEAVKLLPRKVRRKMKLLIAGRKPEWSREYWTKLDLNTESVEYCGEIANKAEMGKLYASVNAVVVPSFDESCSLTALEGAKHGKAVIVTENTGAKYIVGENGLVVKTGSAKALAEAFEYIVGCGRLEEMGSISFEIFLRTSTKEIYYENLIKIIGAEGNMSIEKNREQNPAINVCFIADNDYVLPTSAAITSLCRNSDREYRYNVYVVMPENSSYGVKRYLSENAFGYDNVTVKVVETALSGLEELHRGGNTQYLAATTAALLKFRLANLFPELDKILYLDGDVIVRDDLAALYGYELGDNYVAAVRDLPQVLYDKQQLGAEISGRDYFNSGVMLLNLKKMRDEDAESRLIETKKSYADQSLMDQNILNIVFKGAVLQLPFVYNACYINLVESRSRYGIDKLNALYGTRYKDVYEILLDIKIMHFSSKLKPWYFYDVPLADEWLYYYKLSAMRDVKLQRTFHTQRNVDMKQIKSRTQALSEENKRGFSRVIPIAFAGNEAYLYYAAVTVQSIYENSNSDYLYDINIFVDETVSENMKKRLNSLKYRNLRITLWDVGNTFDGIDLYSVGHYSRQMYYRWLIPEVLSKYDKVLYLDCDIVVNADISRLYDIPLGDNYVAAANNFLRDNLTNHVSNRLGLPLEEYYNSGVLVMNCKKWIENNLKNKCIECLRSYDKLACPDQDVLNVVCSGKILKLDDKWNFQWHHQFPDARTGAFTLNYKERYDKLTNSVPHIIHFTSWVKPWSSPNRVFAEYFWRYCRKNDFYEEILFTNLSAAPKNEKSASINQKKINSLRLHIDETHKSFTYKLSRLISWLPRKVKGYDYTPVCGSNESESKQIESLESLVNEINNSRSFKLALKITAFPRWVRSKLKK
ncbi:MAG: glycosyltransferase [Ruminococcaceae bacterium]|nr:glycosyltransferase [Oscillospiraceae bacterium]